MGPQARAVQDDKSGGRDLSFPTLATKAKTSQGWGTRRILCFAVDRKTEADPSLRLPHGRCPWGPKHAPFRMTSREEEICRFPPLRQKQRRRKDGAPGAFSVSELTERQKQILHSAYPTDVVHGAPSTRRSG